MELDLESIAKTATEITKEVGLAIGENVVYNYPESELLYKVTAIAGDMVTICRPAMEHEGDGDIVITVNAATLFSTGIANGVARGFPTEYIIEQRKKNSESSK